MLLEGSDDGGMAHLFACPASVAGVGVERPLVVELPAEGVGELRDASHRLSDTPRRRPELVTDGQLIEEGGHCARDGHGAFLLSVRRERVAMASSAATVRTGPSIASTPETRAASTTASWANCHDVSIRRPIDAARSA